jgi:hypothetical protein
MLSIRLGVLGLLPPSLSSSSKDPNLAVQDVILGLQAVKLGAAAFGGDARRVTVGGQSSGGTMIRGEYQWASLQGDTTKPHSTAGQPTSKRSLSCNHHSIRSDGEYIYCYIKLISPRTMAFQIRLLLLPCATPFIRHHLWRTARASSA